MIPVLSRFLADAPCSGGALAFATSDHILGVCVRVTGIDSEASMADNQVELLRAWLKSLDPRLIVRFSQENRPVKAPKGFARSQDIPDGISKNLILSICYDGEELIGDIKTLLGLKKESHSAQLEFINAALNSFPLKFEPLSQDQTQRQFILKPQKFKVASCFVDLGSQLVGVVRLEMQTAHPIYQDSLERALMGLEIPFDVVTSVRRLSRPKREAVLRTRFRQDRSANDRVSDIRAEASGLALEETAMNGAELFQFELLVRVYSTSEAGLRESMRTIKERLSPVGDITIETFGCLPSLAATMPGAPMHVPLLEMDGALLSYLPLNASDDSGAADGSGLWSLAAGSSRLLVARLDSSFSSIDLLSPSALNANAIIVGSSGRGKSVLTGLLTQSLLNDPNVKVIKVDVGGSHSKECELLGGTEYRMSLTEPSGICVFTQASHSSQTAPELSRSVLSKYVEVLVFEEGESVLPKTVRIEIDEFVKGYLESKPLEPSIDGFYKFAQGFSRDRLLSRWIRGGMYAPTSGLRAAKAASHKPRGADIPSPSLTYFNFSQIFEAADKDFAQAGMAAVLAQFNLEVASSQSCERLPSEGSGCSQGQTARNFDSSRIILICDETPFFIERCFEFFKFSMANVRKFGAGLIPVVQQSSDLIQNGDTSLIDNAYHRFIFSSDGNSQDFANRMKLTASQAEKIPLLQSVPKVKSEFLYQSGDEVKTMSLKLSTKEYWELTSTSADRSQLEALREAVPKLSLAQAIACLETGRAR